MRAFAYLRTSTDRQELSPIIQLEHVKMFCQMKGHTLVHVFDESGVSGCVKFSTRAQGAELFRRMDEFDVVIFSRLDRAFRSTVDAIMTVQELSAAGKSIVFLDLNIDTSTPAGSLCLQMMAAFAEFERRRIGERTREAMAQLKAEGRKPGPPRFGFKATGRKGVHEVDPQTSAALVRIGELRKSLKKPSFNAIAKALNAEGYRTQMGGPFSHNTVSRVAR